MWWLYADGQPRPVSTANEPPDHRGSGLSRGCHLASVAGSSGTVVEERLCRAQQHRFPLPKAARLERLLFARLSSAEAQPHPQQVDGTARRFHHKQSGEQRGKIRTGAGLIPDSR